MPASTAQLMTVEEFLALPDDGKRRWLHNGELREEGMTTRNRFHSATMANIVTFLNNWRLKQKVPGGSVVCGEAGVRLEGEAGSVYGVDAAYISPEVAAQQTDATTMIDGVPALIVEILSPSTIIENLDEKIDAYLQAGVALIWIIDPHRHTVMIHRPNEEPELVNQKQDLNGGTVLPGFSVPVINLFQ